MHDVIIIGGGPAALTAGIYCTRFGLKTLLLEDMEQPSQMMLATEVENYPSYENISGPELLEKMKAHAKKQGLEIIREKALSIENGKNKIVLTENKKYEAKTVIIATGSVHKKANIQGEKEFAGRGVSYCATCDAPFFKKKKVIVYGGGDSALMYAIYLQKLQCKTTVVYRGNKLRASDANIKKAKKLGVEFILKSTIKQVYGNNFVEGIVLESGKKIECNGIFIAIGEAPLVEIIKGMGINMKDNYIVVDSMQRTNIKGVFAAGSVTINTPRQIITSAAEGAKAAHAAYDYISDNNE